MQRNATKNHVKRFLTAAVMGLALIALTGCYLGGGPFRHAFYGEGHHRDGYGYHEAPLAGTHFYPETNRYRQGDYCGE